MTSKKSIGAQQLLESKASYSGWLKKLTEGTFTKSYNHRYCVLHNGSLYYFSDHSSKSASGMLSLVGYRAYENKNTKKSWNFYLQNGGFLKKRIYYFEAGSEREQEEWIRHINDEIKNIFPNHINLREGDGQEGSSEEEYDDVESETSDYDYAKTRPDDVIMYNPENNVDPSKIIPKAFSLPRNSFLNNTFTGPKFNSSSKSIPVTTQVEPPQPPRRPTFTISNNKQPDLPLKSEKLQKTSYEVVEVNEEPVYDNVSTTDDGPYIKMSTSHGTQCATTDKQPNVSSKKESWYLSFVEDVDELEIMSDENNYTIPPNTEVIAESIYQWKLSRLEAEELLKTSSVDGTYMIRENSAKKQVLSVYEQSQCRHYIIFESKPPKKFMFLSADPEPKFANLTSLITHYQSNNLPTCQLRLTSPYS